MKETVKTAAENLKSGDVLGVYVFCHGLAHDDNQYLATEDGHVSARSLCNIVSQAVLKMHVSDVAFLLLLDCCRKTVGEHDWASAVGDDRGRPVSEEDFARMEAKNLTIAVSYSTCSGM